MCFVKGEKNILGTELIPCSTDPMTGFYRDGLCKSFSNDPGEHTVCAKLTTSFLIFSTLREGCLIIADGQSNPETYVYHRKEIEEWRRHHPTSPTTRQRIKDIVSINKMGNAKYNFYKL